MNTKKKYVEIDDRGRITLPKDLREDVEGFSIETKSNGEIRLIPQKTISLKEAGILKELRSSIEHFKAGKTKKIPKNWIE